MKLEEKLEKYLKDKYSKKIEENKDSFYIDINIK